MEEIRRTGPEAAGEEGSQAPKLLLAVNPFTAAGGPKGRLFRTTCVGVEVGQSGAPAELGNEPHRQQTDAGSSAGRIADPYINLDFFLEKKSFKSSTSTT